MFGRRYWVYSGGQNEKWGVCPHRISVLSLPNKYIIIEYKCYERKIIDAIRVCILEMEQRGGHSRQRKRVGKGAEAGVCRMLLGNSKEPGVVSV